MKSIAARGPQAPTSGAKPRPSRGLALAAPGMPATALRWPDTDVIGDPLALEAGSVTNAIARRPVDDPLEREADAFAEAVMRQSDQEGKNVGAAANRPKMQLKPVQGLQAVSAPASLAFAAGSEISQGPWSRFPAKVQSTFSAPILDGLQE